MRKLWIGLAATGLLFVGCGKTEPATETLPEPVPVGTPSDDPGEKSPSTMPADEHAGMMHGEAAAPGESVAKADLCPVQHAAITGKTAYADHNGKRYYFCCAGCPKSFLENADQIIADNPEWAEKWSEDIPG